MAWTQRKLAPGFGMELSGQTLTAALPDAEKRAVYDAVVEHGVVVVAGQDMSDDDLYRFGDAIGDVVELPAAAGTEPVRVHRLSNLDADGNLLPADDWNIRQGRANEFWHIDSTYVRPRATLSMLYGRVVPPEGADTEFCDLRLAWDALPTARQQQIEGLSAAHSLIHSRSLAGFTDWQPEDYERFRPVERPLVHRHPESGRQSLCLASHIATLSGMEDTAAAAFIAELTEWAAAPERSYAHRWRAGDLVIWDNRSVMHRATPFAVTEHARDMRTLRLNDALDA